MTSGDLVAMIPVDAKMARRKRPPKKGWKMPFGPLYARLKELTFQRVLRADEGREEFEMAAAAGSSTAARLWDTYRHQVVYSDAELFREPKHEHKERSRPLFVEYTVPVSSLATTG
jgi:hypothetical protein